MTLTVIVAIAVLVVLATAGILFKKDLFLGLALLGVFLVCCSFGIATVIKNDFSLRAILGALVLAAASFVKVPDGLQIVRYELGERSRR